MSYYEQARKMNERLRQIFEGVDFTMSTKDRNELINTILWFGQVAKFRCRSNTAYDNFSGLVFDGIAKLGRFEKENKKFPKLQVRENVEQHNDG